MKTEHNVLTRNKRTGILIDKLAAVYSSKWPHYVLISITAAVILIFFLWGVPNDFPTGDSYVHFTYAQNLVDFKELSFNPGKHEGIGTSSILWVIILAFFQWMGISPLITAKIFGIGLLIVSGILFFELAQHIFPDQPELSKYFKSTALTIFAVFSGSMVWLALSGMETILFLTLGLWCLWLYSRESWSLLGVGLGLLTLTRIEGVILAGVVLLVELIRHRSIRFALVKILIPMFLILVPWIIYLQVREGVPVSTSFLGRKFVISETDERIVSQFPLFFWLMKIKPLVHFATWAYFILMYITGSVSLPGPVIDLGGNLVGTELTLPIDALVVGIFCVPLIYLFLKYGYGKLKTVSLEVPHHRLPLVMFAWFFFFNLAYALFLPQVGAAGRYIPLNHMLFWASLLCGGILIRKKRVRNFSLIFTLLLFGVNVNYWREVYRDNIEYMVDVRKQAALFIDQHYPEDTPVGVTDFGAIGFYAQQPVIELLGHINQEVNQFVSEGGSFSDYILEERLCYLMLFGSLDNSGLDYVKEMDFSDDPRFNLVVEQSFSVSLDEWALGNGPIRNYMPVVNVFRVDWRDPSVCLQSLNR